MSRSIISGGLLRRDLNASWAIAKKDVKIYYLTPPTLMFGILFPIFMFLSFAVGRSSTPAALTPSLLSITMLFSASSIGPAVIPTERRVKTYDRFLSAPISQYAIVMGKTLSGFLFSLLIGGIMVIAMLALFGTTISSIPTLFLGLVLASFCFSVLGIMLAMFPRENPGDIMLLLNFIRLPLIFISGIFVTVEDLPYWGQVAASFSPLTYANDLVRYSYGGISVHDPLVDALILILSATVFLMIGKKIDDNFRK